ncbi:MAG: terpene cyclase/mutase family protein [Maribacter sp.]|nr:terpene cyclase/mutase family protein [Maribacter sp.]
MIPATLIENDRSPKFYKNYPRLFSNYFDAIDEEILCQLSQAGYLYYHATLLVDGLIDDKEFDQLPLIMHLQEETIKSLTSIYGAKSIFWNFWNNRKKEYFKAVETEKKLSYDRAIRFTEYADLADQKTAFGKVAIDCIYLLSNQKDDALYHALVKSHYYFSLGFQLYDDVKDYSEDIKKGQFNWAIYEQRKMMNDAPLNSDYGVLHKLLFINGIGQKILGKSISCFRRALEILDPYIESEWKGIVLETKEIIENYLDSTEGYVRTIEKKVQIKRQGTVDYSFFRYGKTRDKVLKNGLDFIKKSFLENYAELKHIMFLSKSEGFQNEQEIHSSDVFQRALLNECLIAICKENNFNSTKFFERECQYLVAQRNRDAIGGWSYFPSVVEIAADIDDLGQMIQLFIACGKSSLVDAYCMQAIQIALSQRTCSNGGLETWIIPKENQNAIQQKQDLFNTSKWGKGPDIEVVANFMYALHQFDSIKYLNPIKNAIKFIVENQNEQGYWDSRWYYGRYYGTYVCLRLFKEYKDLFPAYMLKAIEYIIDHQNKDGGFSTEPGKTSDPLATAFALLSLKLFLNSEHRASMRAENYLRRAQQVDGSWNESNFIKPKAQEPYKSKTITTAFVLKAMNYGKSI